MTACRRGAFDEGWRANQREARAASAVKVGFVESDRWVGRFAMARRLSSTQPHRAFVAQC
jgi:hypothetical protein